MTNPFPAQETERLRRHLDCLTSERDLRTRALACPCCHDFAERMLGIIKPQIAEVERYLQEGGKLSIPICYKEPGLVCLLALTQEHDCVYQPASCPWSFQEPAPVAQPSEGQAAML